MVIPAEGEGAAGVVGTGLALAEAPTDSLWVP